jgi:aspartyl-tRNA synthetase
VRADTASGSNTARHLTEYTGLDLEMQIITDYHEAMRVIDTMLKSVFSALQTHCKREIELVQRHWPHEDLVWLDETPVIEFKEGVKMLVESGWKEENGEPPAEDEDLSTRGEARLCEVRVMPRRVERTLTSDAACQAKVQDRLLHPRQVPGLGPPVSAPLARSVPPRSHRCSFYTHLDPENPRFTNSFDILLRGTEICTGGQRIHDARKLEARIREAGVDARSLDEYMEAFRLGVSPHAGCGIGLERILTTFLGLGDVRWSTLFFRDPKSLPLDHRPPPLRHPEADTLAAASRAALAEHDAHASPEDAPAPAPLAKTPSANGEASTPAKPLVVAQPEPEGDGAQLADGPPSKWPLAKLIANYGDSSNTSWLDSRFQVWRHDASGGAVGFVKRGKFAIVVGNPLCDHTQYRLVIDAFLAHLREKEKLKPIWLLVGEEVEHILGGRLDWSSLMCVVEQRVPKEGRAAAIRGGDIEKKLRKAEREDLHIDEYGFRDEIPQDVKAEVEKRIEDWKKSREGKQLHLTMVDPWQDEGHRAYYVTRSKDKKIQCLVVLAQLSPANGFQIKWALDFPGAISGAIEYTIVHAVSEFGGDSFTFGASAAANFHTVHNLGGLRVRALSKTYAAISAAAGLGGKNDFRKKIGARDEPLYIAFPRHGLRHGGVRVSRRRRVSPQRHTLTPLCRPS